MNDKTYANENERGHFLNSVINRGYKTMEERTVFGQVKALVANDKRSNGAQFTTPQDMANIIGCSREEVDEALMQLHFDDELQHDVDFENLKIETTHNEEYLIDDEIKASEQSS